MEQLEELKRLAGLSLLALPEGELERMAREMAALVSFAGEIGAALEELPGAEDSAADREFRGGMDGLSDALREDLPEPSLPREELLRNAGGGMEGYFAAYGRGRAE